MESFFRYISYVDYYKNEERMGNVGFLRWKLHNGMHQIEIQLKNVNCLGEKYEIKEKNTKKVIGKVEIDKGIGNFIKMFPEMSASGEEYIDIWGDRLYLSDVEGFLIILNPNEYLSVVVKLDKNRKEKKYGISVESGDTKAASENVLIEGIEEKYIEPAMVKEIVDEKIEIIEPIHEDKWKQLCKKYPNIHPFPNSNVFLSIKPEDFIILQQEYQKLIHNSFLLHGFYNYGHMILGKLSEEKETPIYVGVPGVYYEQEKRAAQMFGFVGFESVEHPVQAGSYGYYMIEVGI